LSLVGAAGCGKWSDQLACGDGDCVFTESEWTEIKKLADWQEPERDCSNQVLPFNRVAQATEGASACVQQAQAQGVGDCISGAGLPAPSCSEPENDPAVKFGWLLYYDPRLSGRATWTDQLGRRTRSSRAAFDKPVHISCATCHDPARAGSDFTSQPGHVSVGAGWYDVNVQQTLNAAYFRFLYWNGRADSLWAQAAQVMESPVSMAGDRQHTSCVVLGDPDYVARYKALFGDFPPDLPSFTADCDQPRLDLSKKKYEELTNAQKAMTTVHANVAKAIAAYEWYLRSRGSSFDEFVQEGPRSAKLSASAKRGLKLFVGRASCIDCHNGPLFSDGKFHDIGIEQVGEMVPTVEDCAGATDGKCVCTGDEKASTCLPWGAYAGLAKLNAPTTHFRRNSDVSDRKTPVCIDQRAGSQGDATDGETTICSNRSLSDQSFKGRWRTPSLRDVALTAPYMHNGSLATLDDVVWHYDQGVSGNLPETPTAVVCGPDGGESARPGGSDADAGVGPSAPGAPAPELHPLRLSAQDRADLVAFLKTLTGSPQYDLHHCPEGAAYDCDGNQVTAAGAPATAPPLSSCGKDAAASPDAADLDGGFDGGSD